MKAKLLAFWRWLGPWPLIVALAAAAAFAGLWQMESRSLGKTKAQLGAVAQQLASEQATTTTLRGLIRKQNDSIRQLSQQRAAETAAYEARIAEVRRAGASLDREIGRLLSLRPQSTDELGLCRESRAAVDFVIRKERSR
jgi:septal ring factor EnvC (AmiA/AmiB activator)